MKLKAKDWENLLSDLETLKAGYTGYWLRRKSYSECEKFAFLDSVMDTLGSFLERLQPALTDGVSFASFIEEVPSSVFSAVYKRYVCGVLPEEDPKYDSVYCKQFVENLIAVSKGELDLKDLFLKTNQYQCFLFDWKED